jgi:curved DNA-binding protein CbpA
VAALGLKLPCTAQEIKFAYRQKVKQVHPDHGGDEQRFLWLQSQFEQALALVEPCGGE